jgi:hypothetical protein
MKPKAIRVRAPEGLRMPREENPRRYVTSAPEGELVPARSYYQRAIARGDLELVELKEANR